MQDDAKHLEAEITPAMIDAGEEVILCETGGADLGGLFSASDLAVRVYRAMNSARNLSLFQPAHKSG